jgi:hypothetical protein
MESQKKPGIPRGELRAIGGGRRQFSIGGAVGNVTAWGLGLLALGAVGCAVGAAAWLFVWIWGHVV